VTVAAEYVAEGRFRTTTASASTTTNIDVSSALPETSTTQGAAFTVPKSLEDEVRNFRQKVRTKGLQYLVGDSAAADVPGAVSKFDSRLPEQFTSNAFILADKGQLYIVFSDKKAKKGLSSVNGFKIDREITDSDTNFGVIAATDASFETSGNEKSIPDVVNNPDQHRLSLVQIDSHYRRASILVDPDNGNNVTFPATSGVLTENPNTASSLFNNVGGKMQKLARNNTQDQITATLNNKQATRLRTFSFETKHWASAEAEVNGIVLAPSGKAREFVEKYGRANVTPSDTTQPILYVVKQDFQPQEIDTISQIKSNSGSLDGEVIETETRLYQTKLSVQETLEHGTITPNCGMDKLAIPLPSGTTICKNVVGDGLLQAGVAWDTIPQSREDALFVMGVSSIEQDQPLTTGKGRYRIEGEVVSTKRVDQDLPDGSILLVYDISRVSDIDYQAVSREGRSIIEDRTGQLRSRLDDQIGQGDVTLGRDISFVGDPSTSISVAASPIIDEETRVTVTTDLPSVERGTAEQRTPINRELTLRLLVDGETITSKTVDVNSDSRKIKFTPSFNSTGESNVTVEAKYVAEGRFRTTTASATATTIVNVSRIIPAASTTQGAAFTVPNSLENEVATVKRKIKNESTDYLVNNSSTGNISRKISEFKAKLPEKFTKNTFILADKGQLYVVFTDETPTKGLATVEGFKIDREIPDSGVKFGVIAATDASFETTGSKTSISDVINEPDQHRLSLVQIDSHYRRASILIDPDTGSNITFPATAGVLTENPNTAQSLFNNVGAKMGNLSQNHTEEQITKTVDNRQSTRLRTFSFETKYWASADAKVNGIVLDPTGEAKKFVEMYGRANVTPSDTTRPVLYVVKEKFESQEINGVSAIKSDGRSLDDEIIDVETNLYLEKLSAQETLEHKTSKCTDEKLAIPTSNDSDPICKNVVGDGLLQAGAAWDTVPQSREDVLFVMGVSSHEQDEPLTNQSGRYQIEGEIVSTQRVDQNLPDGSILLAHDIARVGDIKNKEISQDSEDILTNKAGQLRSRLDGQISLAESASGSESTDPGVEITDISIEPSNVNSNSSKHTLEFETRKVSADGNSDTFELTFPDDVVLEGFSNEDIEQSSTVEQNGNTISFSVNPTGGGSAQISGKLDVTLSATN
jgi:hypothetical protein